MSIDLDLTSIAWLITTAAVLVLLFAERTGQRGLKACAKTLASFGFLGAAWSAGALETHHGRVLFAGLVLALIGDVCLLSKAKPWFLAGLVAFLLGHLAYAASFAARGAEPQVAAAAMGALSLPALVVWRWLAPRAGSLRLPVAAYIAVITAMLASAAGTHASAASAPLLGGAVLFYLSDLFVARERFVAAGFVNKAFGLPLYYAGQLLLATFGGAPLS